MYWKIFNNIWIQPAAGDAGGSLGSALALWHIEFGNKRVVNFNDDMKGSYLGTDFRQEEIENELEFIGANFEKLEYEDVWFFCWCVIFLPSPASPKP